MWRYLIIILTGVLFSFYYFPVTFVFLPGINTKMILAVVGLCFGGMAMFKNREFKMPSIILWLSVFALIVSFVGLISVVYNNTQDYAYATYIISMWVWLSSAYAIVSIMKYVHGNIGVDIICKYVIIICLAQCILAQIIDVSPLAKYWYVRLFGKPEGLEAVNRLYGIGASLDTAGIRFSIALIMAPYLAVRCKDVKKQVFYVISWVIITILGSMMARTTYVGCVAGLIYMVIASDLWRLRLKTSMSKLVGVMVLAIIIMIPILIYLYNTDPRVYKLLRFAFEGFFNLIERGEWSLASNERLKTMIIFPESIKTWIIGDGYFSNPYNTDPYYTGDYIEGWYMGTDIGYLRFVFYFGAIGLATFVLFITYSARLCWRTFSDYKPMFILIYLLGLVVWLKVSTDIFLVFALFISLSIEQKSVLRISEDRI